MLLKRYFRKIYAHSMLERCDDDGTMRYCSPSDFTGLRAEAYPFTARAGHRLQGWLYSYEGYDPRRLVVFEHGLGVGHIPYLKEIEMLCRRGYRVFTYDHTGCRDSEGASTNGLAQSLCDLNDCLNTIKADPRFRGLDLSVVGHSWGGFSTMNIVALHPDISHIVAMCGFVSVKAMFDSHAEYKWQLPYSQMLQDMEAERHPEFAGYDAVKSLRGAATKALLIYSDNDDKCPPVHYEILREGLKGREHVRLLSVHNKGHKPTYTEDAVRYLDEFAKARRRKRKWKRLETPKQKERFLAQYDFHRMTQQDEAVWEEIFKALDT